MEDISFRLASIDRSYGSFHITGSYPKKWFGLEKQGNGTVLAFHIVDLCYLLTWELVISFTP